MFLPQAMPPRPAANAAQLLQNRNAKKHFGTVIFFLASFNSAARRKDR
jgi:hypothetical protein